MNSDQDIKNLNNFCSDTLISYLNIEFYKDVDGNLCAKMPVTNNHMQPMGIMHGGASLALAESLGSAFSYLIIENQNVNIVGQNIMGNHLNSVKSGTIYAKCKPIHLGKRTHVVDILITDDTDKEISVCRLTNMIIEK